MQIIIPMSGIGKRFLDAGYSLPKPLILVDGIPIIKHVANLFPDEHNFIFICNQEHLQQTNMRLLLEKIAPAGRIVAIEPHKKGPVYAVFQVFDLIDDEDEVIVNYCDFSKEWNYAEFLQDTRSIKADGAISAYKGFHPHMLSSTNYAFIRSLDRWMLEIREKESFTQNRMQEYASDGTYYFRKGKYIKRFFSQLMVENQHVNGEYYVSLVYNLMVASGLKVSIYEITRMLQWGTPRDLEEYQAWSNYFANLIVPKQKSAPKLNSINLIPLAGRGKRFSEAGFSDPKPLIKISGRPMFLQAANSLAPAEKNIFVCLDEHLNNYPLENSIREDYPNAKIVALSKVTEGQAITCAAGLDHIDVDKSLLIGACDNAMIWNETNYEKLLNDSSIDTIVWTFRHHPLSEKYPEMYGWVSVDENSEVKSVSVKKPISNNPYKDHAIVGTFFFRNVFLFIQALDRLVQKQVRINNEFYVDAMIQELVEMGCKVKAFEVLHYVCWGTPNDLKIFEYWQQLFNQCDWHPYRIALDRTAI